MKVVGRIYIMIGCFFIFIPILKLTSIKIQSQQSLQSWNESIQVEDGQSNFTNPKETELELGQVIGTLGFVDEVLLPVIEGISPEELEKGLGHDPVSVFPGEVGNCLIYGHREQFLWNLQAMKSGDVIKIQAGNRTLHYIVDEIEVMSPTDLRIFRETAHPSLTIVTCYPFIYFGPTEERFVVKANLQE